MKGRKKQRPVDVEKPKSAEDAHGVQNRRRPSLIADLPATEKTDPREIELRQQLDNPEALAKLKSPS
jgi:hypothetical protein